MMSMRERTGRSALVVCCASLLCAGQAQAQSAPSDPETVKKVLGLVKEANAHYDAKAYGKALPLYQEAYGIYPNPALMLRLGETHEALGQLREAVGYYDKVIQAEPEGEKVKALSERLPGLKAKVAPLIRIESSPGGADVYEGALSGDPIGRTPYEGESRVGEVTYIIRKDGYQVARRPVTHEPAGQQRVTVTLEPSAAEGVVELPATSSTSEGMSMGTVGWVTAGTGVALLITGGVFSLLQSGATDDVNSFDKRAPGQTPAQRRAELESLKDTAQGYHSTSLVFYVLGGLVTAAGAGILAYDAAQAEAAAPQGASLRWGVDVSPQGGALSVSGQF